MIPDVADLLLVHKCLERILYSLLVGMHAMNPRDTYFNHSMIDKRASEYFDLE